MSGHGIAGMLGSGADGYAVLGDAGITAQRSVGGTIQRTCVGASTVARRRAGSS
jgi:hypothetical protein